MLSANPLFIQEAIISEGGKKDRKSLWRLKSFPLAGRAAAYKDDFDDDDDDDEEDEDESALVMDENDDDESEEDDEDEDDARPEKRSRPDEGEQ